LKIYQDLLHFPFYFLSYFCFIFIFNLQAFLFLFPFCFLFYSMSIITIILGFSFPLFFIFYFFMTYYYHFNFSMILNNPFVWYASHFNLNCLYFTFGTLYFFIIIFEILFCKTFSLKKVLLIYFLPLNVFFIIFD
jgi:hypothetical protein